MTRERCMCGDPDCPSCGAAMGTYTPPHYRDEDDVVERRCDACLELLESDDGLLCKSCLNATQSWRKI